jgi:hypothetical protein
VATNFCATDFLGPTGRVPIQYQYVGYICTDGTVTSVNVIRILSSPLAGLCTDPGGLGSTCTPSTTCCVADPGFIEILPTTQASAKAELASSGSGGGKFGLIFERGVPNPSNPLSRPDDPITNLPVIGDYTADFTANLGGLDVHLEARLFLFASLTQSRLQGAAYLLDPDSPPSPLWNPHFSQDDGFVTLRTTGGLFVVIPGLPDFFVVR